MSRTRRTLAALALIAMAALISACGSNAPAGTGGSGANTTAADPNHAKAVKFAECIRSNGVTEFPDPDAAGEFAYGIPSESSPLDPSSPAFKHAIGACRNLEPSDFMPKSYTTKQIEERLKFAQCVRANGVPNFPDPTRTGPLVNVSGGQSIPGLHAAIAKCARQTGLLQ